MNVLQTLTHAAVMQYVLTETEHLNAPVVRDTLEMGTTVLVRCFEGLLDIFHNYYL